MPPEPPSNPSNPNTNNANATQPDLTKPPTPPRVSQTYHIAKRLDALGISAQYLEDEHLNIFRAALVNEKTWDTFYALQGNPTMAGLEGANFVASWRARTMILEQQIPVLFPGLAKAIPLPGQPLADEPPKKRQKIDQVIDDRYYTKELDRSTLIEGLAERGQDSAGEAAVPETQSQAQSQSGTMHSQQTTAAQAAGLPTGDSLPAGIPASLASLLPQPPLTFSRKHLLSEIDKLPNPLSQSLRTLISDIRPMSRSKWASDSRIGQEELYDAAERVLSELKDYKECSGPFLIKVNRREYPDYYEIIKNPMDLGTMTKKLRSLEYFSRAQFVADLDLIWQNCFTYNTDPANIYRIMGEKMKERSDKLAALIPDITVQVRTDLPPEEGEEEEDDEEEEEPQGPQGSRAWGGGSKKASKGVKRDDEDDDDEKKDDGTEVGTPMETGEGPMEPAIKAEEGVALPTKSQPAGTQPEPEAQPADGNSMDVKPDPQPEPPLKEEAEQQIEPPEPENLLVADPPLVMTEEDQASLANDLSDPQVSLWYKVTQPVRASVLVEAHLDSLKPFPERKALVRDSLGMGEYEKGFGRYLDRCAKIRGEGVEEYEEVDGDGGLSPESIHGRRALSAEPSKEGEEPPAEEQLLQHVDYFLPELFPMGSVPGIEGPPEVVGADLFEKHGTAPMPSASAYQSARPCESGLTDTIGTGTAEMRKIQDLYVRIGEVTNGTDHTIKGWKRNRVGAWGDEARLPPLRVGEEIGHAAMKSACGRLLAHEGFEVTKADALNVVADAAVERLMLLGRMLRTYVDDFAGEMEPEQMIRHTLVDAGMRDIESFTDYVEGVVGAGKARKNLRDKMEKRYKDLLKDAIRSEDAEFVLDEVEGEPGTAIRVIGLEELGIALDEIPQRIVKGKTSVEPGQSAVRRAILRRTAALDEAVVPSSVDLPPPPPFPPVDPSQLIGLLRPWYDQKLAAGDIAEDEDKKEKVPPAPFKVRAEMAKQLKKRKELGMT